MTTKTSLFNKGIYKATIKRYSWGSVLYFIMLFMFAGMAILLSVDATYPREYHNSSFLLEREFMFIPLIISIVVPTVAGLLIFRFIHSKKTAVFVHSLPVKREANFISSVFAGITLMAVPIIINGLILMLLSLGEYGEYFTLKECFLWIACNFFCVFIMFSSVCLVASITGNSFAMIVLNILFHTIFLIIAATVSVVANMFLFGFPNDNTVIDLVAENILPVRVIQLQAALSDYREVSAADIIIPIVIAIVLYVLSVILYKKRRMETAEDVAGFKVLNGVFKYLLTLTGALIAFAIGEPSMKDSAFSFWFMVIIVSAVIYFACEMVLKKTLRVWKSKKGYFIFAGAFAIVMCVFAFTSFFGYETRVPKKDKVKSVALYEYYEDDEPFVEISDVIDKAINVHSGIISEKTPIKENESARIFHIKYKLKSEGELHRRYILTEEKFRSIMSELYKFPEYKRAAETIYRDNKRIMDVSLNGDAGSVNIESRKKVAELVECIRKDIDSLSYDRIYNGKWSFNVSYGYAIDNEYDTDRLYYESQTINANFKNTIDWVKENGYWDSLNIENKGVLYIVNDWEDLPFVKNGAIVDEVDPEKEAKIIKLQGDNAQNVIDYILYAGQSYKKNERTLKVYQQTNSDPNSVRFLSEIPEEELKVLLY